MDDINRDGRIDPAVDRPIPMGGIYSVIPPGNRNIAVGGNVTGLGGFAPDMATEDIDMTWRLQLSGREVVYEPAALFGMQAPEDPVSSKRPGSLCSSERKARALTSGTAVSGCAFGSFASTEPV